MTTRDLVLSALFAALIVALGLIPAIPVGALPVPITPQSLGVMLAGLILGPVRGGLAVALVVLLVVLGLPVLSGGRGGFGSFTLSRLGRSFSGSGSRLGGGCLSGGGLFRLRLGDGLSDGRGGLGDLDGLLLVGHFDRCGF